MLPSQASNPIKRIVWPCLRFYQQNCASAGLLLTQTKVQKSSVAPVVFSSSAGQTLAVNYSPCDQTFHCHQTTKTFSTSCTGCDVAKEKAEDVEKASVSYQKNDLAQSIEDASTFENLMTLAPTVKSGFQACLVLRKLSSLWQDGQTQCADGEMLLQDTRLKNVLYLVDQDVKKLGIKQILTTVQSLYKMTAEDVFIVQSLITQVLWLTQRIPIHFLLKVLELHLTHQETSMRKSVVKQALKMLERRWVELTNPKDVIFLMYTAQGTTLAAQTLRQRLEERALDIVEKATAKELYRIIYLLSRQGHRNTPLIRAVVYFLNKETVASLSAVHLVNLVYALSRLKVYDVPIMTQISGQLNDLQADLTPKLAASLMTSFSLLRWREETIMQMLLNVIDGKSEQSMEMRESDSGDVSSIPAASVGALDASDKVGIVLSLANLNVDTEQSRDMVSRLVSSPDVQALQQSFPFLWLDVVWSLSVLRMLDAASAGSVLAEDFWGSLGLSDSFQSTIHLIKLNNINAAASYEVEGYTGPFLPATMSTSDPKLLQKGERMLMETLVSALANMAPLGSYTVTDVSAPGGYLIDAEFYVDASGSPVPLSKISQNPSNCHRVALKVLDFAELTLPTSDLTGLHAMAARHLCCQGYTVIQVHHTEVSGESKVVMLVKFLQKKIKDTLQA